MTPREHHRFFAKQLRDLAYRYHQRFSLRLPTCELALLALYSSSVQSSA